MKEIKMLCVCETKRNGRDVIYLREVVWCYGMEWMSTYREAKVVGLIGNESLQWMTGKKNRIMFVYGCMSMVDDSCIFMYQCIPIMEELEMNAREIVEYSEWIPSWKEKLYRPEWRQANGMRKYWLGHSETKEWMWMVIVWCVSA